MRSVTWMARATTTTVGTGDHAALVRGRHHGVAGTGIGATFNWVGQLRQRHKQAGRQRGGGLPTDRQQLHGRRRHALDLQVEPGKPPMKVNSSTEVQGLNADH